MANTTRAASEQFDRPGRSRRITLALTIVASLITYRWSRADLSGDALGWCALTLWLLLVILLRSRARELRASGFSDTHVLARSAAGAGFLIAAASGSSLWTGTLPASIVLVLILLSFGLYLTSGITAMVQASRRAQEDRRGWTLAERLDIWLPKGFGAVLQRDLNILLYALWTPRRSGEQIVVFSNHFVARPMLMAMLCIGIVELVVGHILLRSLPQWIINAHLLLGLLFLVYVVGVIRSFTGLPTTVEDDVLTVRMSVLFKACVPLDLIRDISRISLLPKNGDEPVANAAIIVAPNLLLELREPVLTERIFKPQLYTRLIAIYVDDPAKLIGVLVLPRSGGFCKQNECMSAT